MRIGYFDCFCGAAGDMILGALVDAGCPLPALQETVAALKLPGVSLSAEKVDQKGIAATRVTVAVGPEPRKKHRHLPEIVSIIDRAGLKPRVADGAKTIFGRLAEAEATVHNTAVEKVHFHEVGAADAIVDIVCACAGLALLEIERVICSPIPTGRGTVTCEHGVMPIPAPATTLLLKGVPLADCDEPGELTTPTGAAILTTLANRFGPLPPMCIEAAGYGAGTRTGRTRANFLRLIIGDADAQESRETDAVCLLEAQVDDATGQVVAYACERLLEGGALDVFVRNLQQRFAGDHARVVDQDVDRAVFAEHLPGRGIDRLAICKVAGIGSHRAGQRRTGFLDGVEPRLVNIPQDEMRAFSGKRLGHQAPDAAGRSRD